MSILCSQFSNCPYSEANETLLHPPTYVFLIYFNIFLQSKNVIRDLLHASLLDRILNGHHNSDICIISVAHFGYMSFAF